MTTLRRLARLAKGSPLHPQWLLGKRTLPANVQRCAGKLLDIGAADRWIEPLLPADVEYIAFDYPATGHDLYAAKPSVFGDAAQLPFRDLSFENITCFEVLEHVPDPARVMTEISRVLVQGGRAWISMPFLYPLHDAPYDFQRFTTYGLGRTVEQAGLQIVTIEKSGHALCTAALLTCLALAGAIDECRGWRKAAFFVPTLIAVPTINITAKVLSWVWPDWSHMAQGYQLEVRKP